MSMGTSISMAPVMRIGIVDSPGVRGVRYDKHSVSDGRLGWHVNERRLIIVPESDKIDEHYGEKSVPAERKNNAQKDGQISRPVDTRRLRICHGHVL